MEQVLHLVIKLNPKEKTKEALQERYAKVLSDFTAQTNAQISECEKHKARQLYYARPQTRSSDTILWNGHFAL